MPGFNEVFLSSPELKGLNSGQKMEVLDTVYEQMKQMPDQNREALRNFRNQQMETMYEDMRDRGRTQAPSFDVWKEQMQVSRPGEDGQKKLYSGGNMMQSMLDVRGANPGSEVSKEEKELFERYKERDRKELLDDVANVMTSNPTHWVTGAQKMGLDLLGMASAGMSSAAAAVTGVAEAGETFSRVLKDWNDTELLQAVSRQQRELTKSDPSLFNRLEGAAIDLAMGGAIGVGRRAAANMAIGRLKGMLGELPPSTLSPLQIEGLTALESAKMVASPVTSNVVAGQLMWEGMEMAEKWFDTKGFNEGTKAGLQAVSILLGGALGGWGIEKLVNKIARGETAVAQRVGQMGEWLEKYHQTMEAPLPILQESASVKMEAGQGLAGPAVEGAQTEGRQLTLGDMIRADPDRFSQQFLSIVKDAEVELGPNFNPAQLADEIDGVVNAEQKLKLGEALSVEEAEMMQARGVGVRKDYPFSVQELEEIVPPSLTSAEREGLESLAESKAAVGTEGVFEQTPVKELEQALRNLAEREVVRPQMTQKQGVRRGLETARELEKAGEVEKAGQLRAALAEAVVEERPKAAVSEIDSLRAQYRELNGKLSELREMWKENETPAFRQYVEEQARGIKEQLADIQRRGEKLAGAKTAPKVEFQESIVRPVEKAAPKETVRKEIEKPRSEKVIPILQEKAAIKAERKDVQTLMEKLTPEQRMDIEVLTDGLVKGREYSLGRVLSEEERLDVMASVYNQNRLWDGSAFDPSDSLYVENVQTGVRGISAGYIEGKYPQLAKLMALHEPEAMTTQMFRPDTLLGTMSSLISRSGPATDSVGWQKVRPIVREAAEAWDEVKEALRVERGGNDKMLAQALSDNAQAVGLTPRQAQEVANSILEAFPELNVALRFDSGTLNGAKGLADSLLRVVTVGTDKVSIQTLNHELGHVHFNYGLDASEKLQWLDEMRRAANSEELWKLAFPSYEQKLGGMREKYLADVETVGQDAAMQNLMNADFALNSPLELYAEQWSNFLTSNVLPSYSTLQSFDKLQRGWKEVFRGAKVEFDKMSEATREFFLKTLARPDVNEAKLVSKEEVMQAVGENPFYSADPLAANERIAEIDALLQDRYGQRMVDPSTLDPRTVQNYDIAVGGVGSNAVVQQIPFSSLPVYERVKMLSPDDALLLVERDALSLLHQGESAEVAAEMQLAIKKVRTFLDPSTRSELIDRLTQERMKRETGDLGVDTEGMVIDPMVGNLNTRADIEQMRLDARDSEYSRMDAESRKSVDNAKFYGAKKAFMQRVELAKTLVERGEEGIANFFKGLGGEGAERQLDNAIAKFAKRHSDVMRNPGAFGAEERAAHFALANELEELERAEAVRGGKWAADASARSGVIRELAALEARAEFMEQLMRGAKVKTGYLDVIEGQYSTKLFQADQFAAAWAGQAKSGLDAAGLLSLGARVGYCGLAGLEYDPEGVYLPGFGHVSWSPKKFFDSPFNVAMLPGIGKAASKLGRLGGKFAQSTWSGVLKRLPARMAEEIEDVRLKVKDAVVAAVHPTAGIGEDVADIFSRSKMAAARSQKDFRGFAEVLAENFSAKDRERIWRVLDKHSRWEQLEQAIAVERPDLYGAIQLTRGIMDKVRDEFQELGLISEKMPHSSQGNWLAPYVDDTLSKAKGSRIAVIERANIQGIQASFLGGNKIGWTLKNSNKYDNMNGANKNFREACARDGIEPEVGDRVNEYRERRDLNGNLVGRRFYAIEGTPTDKNFARVYEKEHCWTEHREGYTISEVGEKNGPIKLERNYTVKEKRMAGQSFDIAANLAHTASRIGKDLTNANIFSLVHASDRCIAPDKLADNPTGMPGSQKGEKADFAVAEANAQLFNQHWAYVPEVVDKKTGLLKYGKLSGTYIDKDVFNAIRWKDGWGIGDALLNNSYSAPFVIAHRWLLRNWKMNKTVLSPVAHMNNFVSNLFAGTMMGHNVLEEMRLGAKCIQFRRRELEARKLLKEGKAQESSDIWTKLMADPLYAEYKKVKDAQMADSTMWANEIKASEFYEGFLRELEGGEKAEKGVLGKIGERLKGARDAAANVYEAGDLMFKMGAFISASRQGKTPSEALRYAYESYFDYGTLSPGARILRDTGIFPFVSYAYKAFPAIVRGMRDHPGRFAATLSALELFHLTNINMAFGDGEAVKHSEELDKVLPKYMGDKGLFGAMRTRPFLGLDERGNPQVWDLSRATFGGDFGETGPSGNSLTDLANFDKWAPGNMLASLLSQSPVLAYAMEKATGVNPTMKTPTIRGGTQLEDPNVKERRERAEWHKLWNMWAPNWPGLPFTYSTQAIGAGLRGQGLSIPDWMGVEGTGLNDYGEPKPLGSAVAAAVGIKVRTKDLRRVPAELKANLGQVNLEQAEVNKMMKSQSWTEEEKKARLSKLLKTKERQAKVRQEKGAAALSLIRAANAKKRETGGTSLPN